MSGRRWMILLAPLLVGFAWPWTVGRLSEEGRAAWETGDWKTAERSYAEARAQGGELPDLLYNQGTAQLAAGDHAAALETLSQLRTSDAQLQARADYNRGNALYHLGQYEAAAAAYEATLNTNPADLDARHNLELCRRRQNEQQQRQGQQPQNQPSPQQQQQQGQSGQSAGGNQPQQGQPTQGQPGSGAPHDAYNPDLTERKLSRLDADERLDRDKLKLRPDDGGQAGGWNPFDTGDRGLYGSGQTEDW